MTGPRVRRVVFATAVLVAGLTVLEGLARTVLGAWVARALPSAEMQRFVDAPNLVFDAELGWRPAASHSLRGTDNGLWFMERVPAEAPTGTLRGFALGDSQTLGAGLLKSQAWPAVTDRVLNERGVKVEVINAASAGYRSSQVLRLVESRLLAWHFDFLLVDCQLNDSAQLPRAHSSWTTAARSWLFYSRLYRLLWVGVAAARGDDLGPVGEIHQLDDPASGGAGNHRALAELGRTRGFEVIFVDYPFMAEPAKALAPASGLPSGARVAETTPALLASGLGPNELFLDNNHLSVAGAEIVGAAVASAIEPILRGRTPR